MKVLLVCLVFVANVLGDDFYCPPKITLNDGTTGVIPQGATGPYKFDNGTFCMFKFDVPLGYAIKMELSAVYDISRGDSLKFDYFFISSGADKQVEWYMGNELFVTIYSATGNLTFFANYTYVDVSKFTQVLKNTGDSFNSTLEAGKYYTVQGAVGDTVTFNIGQRETGFVDQTTYEVFVFDGPDITNSPYLGRLTEFHRGAFQSSKNTLTFLNLYGDASDTVILCNDFSKVKDFPQYNVILLDPNTQTIGDFYQIESKNSDSWYTFVCDGCDYFYIEALTWFTQGASDANSFLTAQGMSPTAGLAPVLNYTFNANANMSLPQLIPTPMATFHSYKTNIHYVMSTTAHLGYYNAGDEKARSISTPTLWNPNADPNFDYTFSDPVQMFNFSIFLDTVTIVNTGDQLLVEVGSTDGTMGLLKTYKGPMTLKGVPLAGVGHYLNLKYTGSKDSVVIVNFEEDLLSLTTVGQTTVTSTTTPKAVVTSTVPSSTMSPTSTVPGSTVSSTVASTVKQTGSTVTQTGATVTQTVGTSTIVTTTRSASSITGFLSFLIMIWFL